MEEDRHEPEMVSRLGQALGERLLSVVVYGPIAHDDYYPGVGSEHLMVVVVDLEIDTLRRLGEPVRWWLKKRKTWPRLFSTELLRTSSDVYPIELLEISRHHRLLFGPDPMQDVVIDHANLRTQCERELREKLMRLREGYVEVHGRSDAQLFELLAVSYASFVRIFRACLFLVGAPIADHDSDVVTALCTWLDRTPGPFLAVDRIARRERRGNAEQIFADYYRALTAVEAQVDRMIIHPDRRAP